jgi:hypothetical protein
LGSSADGKIVSVLSPQRNNRKQISLYQSDYDEKHPIVAMDETNKQLLGEVREPLPMKSPTKCGRRIFNMSGLA